MDGITSGLSRFIYFLLQALPDIRMLSSTHSPTASTVMHSGLTSSWTHIYQLHTITDWPFKGITDHLLFPKNLHSLLLKGHELKWHWTNSLSSSYESQGQSKLWVTIGHEANCELISLFLFPTAAASTLPFRLRDDYIISQNTWLYFSAQEKKCRCFMDTLQKLCFWRS